MSSSRTYALVLSRPVVIGGLVTALALVYANTWLTTLSTRDITAADQRAAEAHASLVEAQQLLDTVNVDAANGSSAAEIQRRVATLQQDTAAALSAQAATSADRVQLIRAFNTTLAITAGLLTIAAVAWLGRRIRDFSSLVTVCAWTRRVQWEGRWMSFEEYLQTRFNLRFTHGICEEAAAKMQRDAARAPMPAEPRRPRLFPRAASRTSPRITGPDIPNARAEG